MHAITIRDYSASTDRCGGGTIIEEDAKKRLVDYSKIGDSAVYKVGFSGGLCKTEDNLYFRKIKIV